MIAYILSLVARVRDDRGATAVEYGLMVGLIAVVIIAAVTLLGGNLTELFNGVAGDVEVDAPAAP
jgi:pilus assembly protein Flp/PilA